MSSPAAPPGAIPPAPIEPGSPRGGCARSGLIGCGVAGLAVLILFAVFFAYARKRPETITDLMMRQIEKNYAPDVRPEEKEDLRQAYAGFRKAVQERRVRREEFDRLRGTLSFSGSVVTRERVRELTRIFREAAAPEPSRLSTPAAGLVTPSPIPSRSPIS